MASFTIEDVRETMPREVSAFLLDIEQGTRAFLAMPSLHESSASQLLRAIRHDAHAIFGSSALVSAQALASCAESMERLTERAHSELLEAQQRLRRAESAVRLLPAGVEQMRLALELELEGRGEEAEWNVAEWLGQTETALDELCREPAPARAPSLHPGADEAGSSDAPPEPLPALELASSRLAAVDEDELVFETDFQSDSPPETLTSPSHPPVEFSFDDLVEPGVPVRADEAPLAASAEEEDYGFTDEERVTNAHRDIGPELLGVFHDEARDSLVALQGYINALGSEPTVAESAGPLERIYHTLKGAAAMVGLEEVSRRAEALQQRAEGLLVSESVGTDTLSTLVDETNQLFSLAGLADARVGMPAAPPPSVARPGARVPEDVRREFMGEAKELHRQATTLVAELSSRSDDKLARSILETLAGLFHRLKGSAKLVSEDGVAEVADSLLRACEAERAPTTAALSLGLARVASKLGLLAAPGDAGTSEDPEIARATRESFEAEAKQLLESAVRLTREFEASGAKRDVNTGDVERDLARLLHHLGGSARIVGDGTVADEASALERLLKGRDASSSASLEALGERLAALRARFGVDSHASQAMARPAEETRRDAVSFAAVAEIWPTFTLECAELLEVIEKNCWLLEDSRSPKHELSALLRAVHTLKGVVNTIGLTPTGDALHRVEDLLEMLLESRTLPPTKQIATLLLETQAEVKKNLQQAPEGFVETRPKRLERRINALLEGRLTAHGSRGSATADSREPSEGHPSAQHSSEISLLDGAERRVIRVATERLDVLMNLAGELVVSRSRLSARVERLRTLQGELARGSRRLLQSVDSFREENEFANLDGRQPLFGGLRSAEPRERRDDVALPALPVWGGFGELELDRYEAIHVLSRSLSELTSDFSELHTQLSRGLVALSDDADVVGGIVSSIQGEIARARMVPLDALFMRLRLPLRDAALRERKEVRVVVSGEGVPVDKTIADALFQPMLHLVRNAVAHGIESAEGRERSGKPRAGTIALSARQESGQIVIEVRDDGGGLDLAALHARGVQLGLIPLETPLGDPSVAELVFAPGLSTKRTANDVAGRGVGCDVVKRAVERLNGSIRVESRAGEGTVFLVRLPLTLAITRALVVRQGTQTYAIPLHFAERIIDAHEQELTVSGALRRIKLDDAYLPVRTLGEFFGAPEADAQRGPILSLRVGDARMALQVDAIAAHEEIVVKGLGALLSGHPIFAGITIRGTGELAPILDVPSLVEAKGSSAAQARGRALPERTAAPAVRHAAAPTPAKLRVLFADDSVSVRKVAEHQLRELGVEVVTAVDGVDALAKLREQRVDLLFTDLEMPRMHGFELIRELRFLPAYKELPIVVVTSRSGQKHQEQARQLGANEYVTKPFTSQTLSAAIKRWGHRSAERPQSTEANLLEPAP